MKMPYLREGGGGGTSHCARKEYAPLEGEKRKRKGPGREDLKKG